VFSGEPALAVGVPVSVPDADVDAPPPDPPLPDPPLPEPPLPYPPFPAPPLLESAGGAGVVPLDTPPPTASPGRLAAAPAARAL